MTAPETEVNVVSHKCGDGGQVAAVDRREHRTHNGGGR